MSAIKVAQAVEHINPLFFEDPLAPAFIGWRFRWAIRLSRLPVVGAAVLTGWRVGQDVAAAGPVDRRDVVGHGALR